MPGGSGSEHQAPTPGPPTLPHLIGTKWRYRVPAAHQATRTVRWAVDNDADMIAGTPDYCLVVSRVSWVEG